MSGRGDEVRTAFAALSNWGRWGSEDNFGTLNLLTPELCTRGAQLITRGLTVSCARMMVPTAGGGNPPATMHLMLDVGDRPGDSGESFASDWVGLNYHGFATTHIDAHSHAFLDGELYNGRKQSDSISPRIGARAGGVQLLRSGIAGRGVLLDLASLAPAGTLPTDALFGPVELDECVAAAGLELSSGDMVLIRTGRDVREANNDYRYERDGGPGLSLEGLRWLAEREVALLGSDATTDRIPSPYPGWTTPIHVVAIAGMGMCLIDNAYLEDLSRTCSQEGRWTFFLVIAPLPLKYATGSPVNPIAIF